MESVVQGNHNEIFCAMDLQWIPLYKGKILFSLWTDSQCKFIAKWIYNGIFGTNGPQWNFLHKGIAMESFA